MVIINSLIFEIELTQTGAFVPVAHIWASAIAVSTACSISIDETGATIRSFLGVALSTDHCKKFNVRD